MDSSLTLTRRIQLKELEILKVFQDICRKHNLRYFAIGGTCLGAVRHKGFIPWDDDVDVAMPYEDYVKFLELAKTELPEHYAIFDHLHFKHHWLHYFCKLHDTRTAFIEGVTKRFKDGYLGLFIDIFPVHGFPKNKVMRRLVQIFIFTCRVLNNRRRFPYHKQSSLARKILWIAALPFKLLVPYYFFSKLNEKIMSRYPFGCSDTVNFPWRRPKLKAKGWYSDVFPYEAFKETIDLPFEDTVIAVPKGYDRYLTIEFGDYMTPPTEEAQKRIHSRGAIVDFDRPYTYYQEHPEAVKC